MKKIEKVVLKHEGKQMVVEIDATAKANIWHIVKDWPDIISNEENMKKICDMNFANSEQIEEVTYTIFRLFEVLNVENPTDTVIRIVEN